MRSDFSIQMTPFLLQADAAPSRFDPSMLSHQHLMELLVGNLSEEFQAHFQDDNGGFSPLQSWNGLTLTEDGDLEDICWDSWSRVPVHLLCGTFEFRYLPQTLEALHLDGARCQCTLDFGSLPSRLRSLTIMNGLFTGTIDLKVLPKSLVELIVEGNEWSSTKCDFCGAADLTQPPPDLNRLEIRYTKLSGTIELDHLSQMIEHLRLGFNNFEGTVSLEKLPPCLWNSEMSGTRLQGV